MFEKINRAITNMLFNIVDICKGVIIDTYQFLARWKGIVLLVVGLMFLVEFVVQALWLR